MLKENEFIIRNGPLTTVVDKDTGQYLRNAGPDDLPKVEVEEPSFKIEIAVCENIDRAVTTSGKGAPATYHVEVRFVPRPGAHSICFQGERFKDRAKAEADKAYVESVLKRSVLLKPKPLKERKRVKARKRSRKS